MQGPGVKMLYCKVLLRSDIRTILALLIYWCPLSWKWKYFQFQDCDWCFYLSAFCWQVSRSTAASDATDHNGAPVTVAHMIPFLWAWKSFSQSHNRFVSARLCIEVLHIECYLCINATCVIVRGIYDLCVCALLYIIFLFKYLYTEYSYLLYRVFLYKYCYREYSYLLYIIFLFNVALDLIKKIFQGGIISKELWMPRSHVLTVAIFIYGGTWNIKCMQWTPTYYKNWKQVSDVKLTVFLKMN